MSPQTHLTDSKLPRPLGSVFFCVSSWWLEAFPKKKTSTGIDRSFPKSAWKTKVNDLAPPSCPIFLSRLSTHTLGTEGTQISYRVILAMSVCWNGGWVLKSKEKSGLSPQKNSFVNHRFLSENYVIIYFLGSTINFLLLKKSFWLPASPPNIWLEDRLRVLRKRSWIGLQVRPPYAPTHPPSAQASLNSWAFLVPSWKRIWILVFALDASTSAGRGLCGSCCSLWGVAVGRVCLGVGRWPFWGVLAKVLLAWNGTAKSIVVVNGRKTEELQVIWECLATMGQLSWRYQLLFTPFWSLPSVRSSCRSDMYKGAALRRAEDLRRPHRGLLQRRDEAKGSKRENQHQTTRYPH